MKFESHIPKSVRREIRLAIDSVLLSTPPIQADDARFSLLADIFHLDHEEMFACVLKRQSHFDAGHAADREPA